ncbi:P2X purinoceptor 3 isoform X3 [Caretta caretta]|uniref:P2X purinoceptor 3 isoform X3 n=1 Tax=Caretta caretta TaxID=8467 RepID=UPI00209435B3|nr:P2X purinoceptor 3 isoform X3 [Caretta caretta]
MGGLRAAARRGPGGICMSPQHPSPADLENPPLGLWETTRGHFFSLAEWGCQTLQKPPVPLARVTQSRHPVCPGLVGHALFLMPMLSSSMNCVAEFFTYETTKSVVVKSWTVGVINRVVQLLVISYFIGWVFLHEKAYQVRDTSIESSVVTKVKGFGKYTNRVMDTADYVTPPQGTSVFVIITKQIVTENQVQGFCPESEVKYSCVSDSDCQRPVPTTGGGILTGRCVNYNRSLWTCEIQGWCPAEVDTVQAVHRGWIGAMAWWHCAVTMLCPTGPKGSLLFSHLELKLLPSTLYLASEPIQPDRIILNHISAPQPRPCTAFPDCARSCTDSTDTKSSKLRPIMLEAENFTLFIKNSIRFPLFDFEKGNLLPNLTAQDIRTCRFHPVTQPFCPILRLGDIVRFAGQDFAKLASTGGILGIKIGWVCDLDRSWEHCVPSYTFTRLDSVSEKNNVSPGYNFRYAKYYRRENGTEYRTLMKAFGIRFDVLVYGNAGKFNIIPTLINTVAAFTSVGVVSATVSLPPSSSPPPAPQEPGALCCATSSSSTS